MAVWRDEGGETLDSIALMATIHLLSCLAVLVTPLARMRELPGQASAQSSR